MKTVERSLADFCAGLAQDTPEPSPGSLAAFQSAAGASVASMAFRATSGEAHAAVAPFMAGRAEELDELRAQALELVERDGAVFAALTAAGDDPAALRTALWQALQVPFETAELALGALRITAVGANDADGAVRADCLVAGAALWSAVEGGAALVRANAEALERAGGEPAADGERLVDVLAELEAMRAEAAGLLGEVQCAAKAGGVA